MRETSLHTDDVCSFFRNSVSDREDAGRRRNPGL
jgi:hypothetical protein